MSAPSKDKTSSDTYLLREKDNRESEWAALDSQHAAWREFLGNALSYAPLDNPNTILDLGSGTGAWALQAALTYPNATITAADISPLPAKRKFPLNVHYKYVDITQPFPFEENSFDVVHIRFVLTHLPFPGAIVPRILRLVRPGGWVLLEDLCFNREPGPGRAQSLDGVEIWYEHAVKENHQDGEMGRHLAGLVKESEFFEPVEEKVIPVTRGKAVEDLAHQRFGDATRRRFKASMTVIHQHLVEAGKQPKAINFDELWDEGDDSIFLWIHLVWAKKRV